jgi:predicted Zn finger-like uncharacterized protein
VNVSCPDCQSVFRVDPAKVPPAGVRARCSVCGGIMSIGHAAPSAASTAEPEPRVASAPADAAGDAAVIAVGKAPAATAGALAMPEPVSAPVAEAPREAEPISAVTPAAAESVSPRDHLWKSPDAVPAVRFSAPAAATEPAPVARQAEAPRPAPVEVPPPDAASPAPTRPSNPYLANDPRQKARRLARALVSDLVAYHPQRREEGLRTGALKQLFRDEIRKSYEEYVEQVGSELAESTPFFRDALNDVLAGGRKMF